MKSFPLGGLAVGGSIVRWVVWAIAGFFRSRTLLVAENVRLRQLTRPRSAAILPAGQDLSWSFTWSRPKLSAHETTVRPHR